MSDVTANAASWFGGLGNATQGGGGNYPNRGEYVAEILSLTRKVSTDPKKAGHRLVVGDLRIAEVLASFPAEGGLKASNRVGETVGFYADLNGAYPSLELGKLRGIIEAAVGNPDEATIDAILGANGCPRPEGVAAWDALAAYLTEPPGTRLAGVKVRLSGVVVPKRDKSLIVVSRFAGLVAPAAAAA